MIEAGPKVRFRIAGYGVGLPEGQLNNVEIGTFMEAHGAIAPSQGWDQWIMRDIGVSRRPIADPRKGESLAGLLINAGLEAIAKENTDPESISVLYVGTSTNPKRYPAVVHEVQDALGLKNCKAEDVSIACSGFMHPMADAMGMLALGENKVMVAAGDTVSWTTNPADPTTYPVFSDYSGAVIFERVEEGDAGLLGKAWDNQGQWRDLMDCGQGEGKYMQMKGNELARRIIPMVVKLGKDALIDAKMEAEDIDWVVMHQPSQLVIDAVVRRLGIPREKIGETIKDYGNASAGTVPLTYAKMRDEGKIEDGDIVMWNGVGVGAGGVCLITREGH